MQSHSWGKYRMAKRSLITSSEMERITHTSTNDTSPKRMLYPPKNTQSSSKLWLWIVALLLIGIMLFGGVSYVALHLLQKVHITVGSGYTQPLITTYPVGRHGMYAELTYTVLNTQYASSFPNDTIQ